MSNEPAERLREWMRDMNAGDEWDDLIRTILATARRSGAVEERERIRAAWLSHEPFAPVPLDHEDWLEGESWAEHVTRTILDAEANR